MYKLSINHQGTDFVEYSQLFDREFSTFFAAIRLFPVVRQPGGYVIMRRDTRAFGEFRGHSADTPPSGRYAAVP
jgi:hypothetical protein